MRQDNGQVEQETWGISPLNTESPRKAGSVRLLPKKILAGGFMGMLLGGVLTLIVDEPAHADWADITQRQGFQEQLLHYGQEAAISPEVEHEISRQTVLLEAGLKNDYRSRIPAWNKPQRKTLTLDVTATAYNNVPSQTDDTPDIAAWGDRIEPGMALIAVSRDLLKKGLKRGMKVRISGLEGEFIVLDKMNKRYKKRIDIYMGKNIAAARQFGKRQVAISWTNSAPATASTLVAKR